MKEQNEQAIKAANKVVKGVTFLNETFTDAGKWYDTDHFDLETFDIESMYRCVLGQVFGHFFNFYETYIEGLNIDWNKEENSEQNFRTQHAQEHGFYPEEFRTSAIYYGKQSDSDALEQAWITVVTMLRSQEA